MGAGVGSARDEWRRRGIWTDGAEATTGRDAGGRGWATTMSGQWHAGSGVTNSGSSAVSSILPPSRRRTSRSEAGFTEYFNTEARDEFRCAGVNVRRMVVESKGLVLPTYANAHKLVYIVQGRGVLGIAMPGCPATFQQMATASSSSEAQLSTRKLMDEHQQLQQFSQASSTTATTPTSSIPDQGSFTWPESPGAAGSSSHTKLSSRATQNIFAGFNPDMLAEALGVSRQTVIRLQGQNDQRGAIIRVEHGLQAVQPSFQTEPATEEQSQEEEEYVQRAASCSGQQNGLDEIMCASKLTKNINNPQSTDIFNPRGGRITRANSQNFPILNTIQMSATRTVLQNNALLAPHWTMNAHTVMYVTAGQGRIQVVDHRGRSVFDGELHQQQILLIPQNFVVSVKAQREGFAWVSFKTNHNAIDSQIAGKASVLRALPVDVIANAYRLSREESRSLKFNRGDEMAVFAPRNGEQINQQ
ncbi:hypothetical protein GUJ93_ZPchr0007g3708 [Zizania palustris]|uniref:Cupin type-1 domain-containing protein n=1 Tax=Zizania palustris TaxID=103762 RepID=A0A8J5VZF5_ZIZPA|nr:hypothetical protein GUJ93_ZPchr0007g3708 [Zizania palustris]